MPPVSSFYVIGDIDSTETLVFNGKCAKFITKIAISKIMRIRGIMSLNLQVHETLSCVCGSQAETQFDIVGGISWALGWSQDM